MQDDVDELRGIMVRSIDQIAERGERLELLVDKTENLDTSVSCVNVFYVVLSIWHCFRAHIKNTVCFFSCHKPAPRPTNVVEKYQADGRCRFNYSRKFSKC